VRPGGVGIGGQPVLGNHSADYSEVGRRSNDLGSDVNRLADPPVL